MTAFTYNGSTKLGDKISLTHIPYNWFRNFNTRLVDRSGLDVFKFNPYVIRNDDLPITELKDLWKLWMNAAQEGATLAEKQCFSFGIPVCYLNRPNLYFPAEPTLFRAVVVHTTSSRTAIAQHVINHIRRVKTGFLYQVGGKGDIDAGLMDRRGDGFWETVEYVSRAEEAIVLDSAVYHIARCFPHVRIKVVLAGLSKQQCREFRPFDINGGKHCGWIEHGHEYFSEFSDDLGISSSYLKI